MLAITGYSGSIRTHCHVITKRHLFVAFLASVAFVYVCGLFGLFHDSGVPQRKQQPRKVRRLERVAACMCIFILQISSVRPRHGTRHLRKVRYEFHTGTRHFGKFGTRTHICRGTGIPFIKIPGVPVLVLHGLNIPYRTLWYDSV